MSRRPSIRSARPSVPANMPATKCPSCDVSWSSVRAHHSPDFKVVPGAVIGCRTCRGLWRVSAAGRLHELSLADLDPPDRAWYESYWRNRAHGAGSDAGSES